MDSAKNKLYYGDNLEVLKRYVKPETVDLVYLDPPFNSRAAGKRDTPGFAHGPRRQGLLSGHLAQFGILSTGPR
jgi:DNA modification methylase